MSEKPSPAVFVEAMMQAAMQADKVADIPVPGTFAKQYADAHPDVVTAENVEVFMHGAAVVNLLVQESILRVVLAGRETAEEAGGDPGQVLFGAAAAEGGQGVATLIAATIDDLIRGVIEGPAYDRAFEGIVRNF